MKLHLQAGEAAPPLHPALQRWKVHIQLFIMLCIINAAVLDMLNITNNIRARAFHRLTKLMTYRVFSCPHHCIISEV